MATTSSRILVHLLDWLDMLPRPLECPDPYPLLTTPEQASKCGVSAPTLRARGRRDLIWAADFRTPTGAALYLADRHPLTAVRSAGAPRRTSAGWCGWHSDHSGRRVLTTNHLLQLSGVPESTLIEAVSSPSSTSPHWLIYSAGRRETLGWHISPADLDTLRRRLPHRGQPPWTPSDGLWPR